MDSPPKRDESKKKWGHTDIKFNNSWMNHLCTVVNFEMLTYLESLMSLI